MLLFCHVALGPLNDVLLSVAEFFDGYSDGHALRRLQILLGIEHLFTCWGPNIAAIGSVVGFCATVVWLHERRFFHRLTLIRSVA